MRILWLASWYPNAQNPTNGDFVQRHARAVSAFVPVYVINTDPAEPSVLTDNCSAHSIRKEGQLTEETILYRKRSRSVWGRILSSWSFFRLSLTAIRHYTRTQGRPDLIHVHVVMRAGILALYLNLRYGIPYVISEHWAGYVSDDGEALYRHSYLSKFIRRMIIKRASAVSAVSSHLAACMRQYYPAKKVDVIPNVVNTDIFSPSLVNRNKVTTFVHASGMGGEKRVKTIIRAFAVLLKEYDFLTLQLAGAKPESLYREVSSLGIDHAVVFHGMLSQEELASLFREADAFILFSTHETFSCVAIEAHACGIPVISSRIPALEELVPDARYGFFAEGNDPGSLALALKDFIKHNPRPRPDRQIAAITAGKFSYPNVGKMFLAWYERNI